MTDESCEQVAITDGSDFVTLLPGYYPPTNEERRDAYQHGLVSLDANALLDLYRFSESARNELFQILEKLQPRLFITNQAALELHRNRLSVVESRLGAAREKCEEIKEPLRSVVNKIEEFANRYQIDTAERNRLVKLVEDLQALLASSIEAAGTYDLTREDVRAGTDAVIKRLQTLTDGRVGGSLNHEDFSKAVKEAERRREERIPPGYAEKKPTPELRAGDYILWRQLMNEAAVHGRPVLLVSNEKKEDWILKGPSDQILGPRPELVLEMRSEAGVLLHTVTVVGLLKEAPEFLGIEVSSSTIREAEAIPDKAQIDFKLVGKARETYSELSESEESDFIGALLTIQRKLLSGEAVEDAPTVVRAGKKDNTYLLRWSAIGRAMLRLEYESDHELPVTVLITDIGKKKTAQGLFPVDE